MPDEAETITIVLSGEVSLEDFSDAIDGWRELIAGIAVEIEGAKSVRWILDAAASGSFSGTMRAVVQQDSERPIARSFVEKYTAIGRDIRRRNLSGYSPRIRRASEKMIKVIGERVTSIRFETEIDDAEIFSSPIAEKIESNEGLPFAETSEGGERFVVERRDIQRSARGSVRGNIEAIMSRKSLRFTLYDSLSDHAISCYVRPGNEELMRDAWGETALVEGIVRRDAATGKVTSIRQVDNIIVLKQSKPGGWRTALRCAPSKPGELSPEAAIRRLRDAE